MSQDRPHQVGVGGANIRLEIGRKRLGHDRGAESATRRSQRAHVVGVQPGQGGIDAFGQAGLGQEPLIVGRGRDEPVRYEDAGGGQVRYHLAKRGILPADRLQVVEPDVSEPANVDSHKCSPLRRPSRRWSEWRSGLRALAREDDAPNWSRAQSRLTAEAPLPATLERGGVPGLGTHLAPPPNSFRPVGGASRAESLAVAWPRPIATPLSVFPPPYLSRGTEHHPPGRGVRSRQWGKHRPEGRSAGPESH